MNWREQIKDIEKDFGFHKERNWRLAIDLVDRLLKRYPSNVELNIRGIYILHNILLEEKTPDKERDRMTDLLQKWFNQSNEKFSDNAEYLFFIGKILHIAEWYFGLDDNKLAVEFQKKAMEKEPDNLLYEWAYRLSCNDVSEGYLAHQLMQYEKSKISWLERKGFPGEYVLEHLKMSHEEYLKKNPSE